MIKKSSIDLVEGEWCDSWYLDGTLWVRIGIITLALDKNLARELIITLENAHNKINDLGLELEDATS